MPSEEREGLYRGYAEGYTPTLIWKSKPSVTGFSRKYLLSCAPVVACTISTVIQQITAEKLSFVPGTAWTMLTISLFLMLSWVLRSPEAMSSTLLSLILPVIFPLLRGILEGRELGSLFAYVLSTYTSNFEWGLITASVLVLLATEARRQSFTYVITEAGVTIKGGIWRRQEHTIVYGSIGRVILEQSPFGRLFNYGTVILVSPAEWGSEYYARSAGADFGKGTAKVEVGYARVLKEVSRDPGKCLYGIKEPRKVKEVVETMIQAPYRAEIDQARFLKDIKEKLSKD